MREQIVKIAGVCCMFLACVAEAPQPDGARALPGVGSSDRRRVVSLDAMPFRALARVQTELGARCTGFLIAPNLVMTAAHCLFLPKVRRTVLPSSVHVLLGYRAGAWRAHARVAAFRIAPGYRFGAEAATAGGDRVVLVLDEPIGGAADVLALQAPPVPPQPVILAGYGQDRDEVPVVSPACVVGALGRDGDGRPLLLHDCQATAGTSGAPLVWREADGRWAAIGVQIEARVGAAGGVAAPALDPAASVATPPGRSADR